MKVVLILAAVVVGVWFAMWNVGDHFEQKEAREAQQQAEALAKEISPDDALRLAKVVDDSGSVDVRNALSKALSDGKITYAEFEQVSSSADRAAKAREREIAKAALDTAAKGYSE